MRTSALSTASRIDDLIADFTRDPFAALPRAVVLVANRDGSIYEGAGGFDQVPSDPAELSTAKRDTTVDSIFEWWSLTKLVTTIACLQLIERGALREDDDVARWLPQIRQVKVLERYDGDRPVLANLNRSVTVKMLLTHTAGSELGMGKAVTPDFNRYIREELGLATLGDVYMQGDAALLARLPFTSQPGTNWQYSYCLDWLALLIEAVSGMAMEAYCKANIFKPLGICDVTYRPNPGKVNLTFVQNDGTRVVGPPVTLTQHQNMGGAGLSGSGPSILRIVRVLLNRGELDGKRVLERTTVDKMFSPQIEQRHEKGIKAFHHMLLSHFYNALGLDASQRWTHSYGGALSIRPLPTGRSSKALYWSGGANCQWVCDPAHGIAFVIMVNTFPYYHKDVAKFYAQVETLIYSGLSTGESYLSAKL